MSEQTSHDLLSVFSGFVPLWTRWLETSVDGNVVSASRLRLMAQIDAGGPQTITAISEALNVTPRNAATLVDNLHNDGLVVRTPHPSDRRAVLVRLTDRGKATLEAQWSKYLASGSEALNTLSDSEQTQLLGLMVRLTAGLRESGR